MGVRGMVLALLAGQALSFPVGETFATAPAWTSTHHAPWTWSVSPASASVTWGLEPTGGAVDGSGNTSWWKAVRSAEGSSVVAIQYAVPAGTDIYAGVWMRVPYYDPTAGANNGEDYWVETGFRMGAHAAQSFDVDPGWTVVKKYAHPNGAPDHDTGDTWVWSYTTTPINSGVETVMTMALKFGVHHQTSPVYAPPAPGFAVGWDGLSFSDSVLSAPPAGGGNPPAGGAPPAPPGGGGSIPVLTTFSDNPNGDRGVNDACSCSTIGGGGLPLAALAWAVFLLALGRRR